MKKSFAILLSMLLVLTLVACTFGEKSNPQIAYDNLAEVFNGNYENLEDLAPEKFWIWVQSIDEIEGYKKLLTQYFDERVGAAAGQYGVDAVVSFKINDVEELEDTDKVKQKLAETLKNVYDIDEELEMVCALEGVQYISGSEGSNEYEHIYYAAKIDGVWYPLSTSGNDFYIGLVGLMS